jgi:ubiquinone/menaquinone biosynthesis C-methylase UbiE
MMSRYINWDAYTERLVAVQSATATDGHLLRSLARGRVLDAGCGTGIHLGRLTSSVQTAIGVDMGMPGLRSGKSTFDDAIFIAANLIQLPFRDNIFDFIYSIDVLEHLESPFKALLEYYRVCTKDGYILIQTPIYPVKRVYDLWHWIRRERESLADDPTHISPLNTSTLKDMVSQAGLRVVSVRARNIAFQRFLPKASALRSSWVGHHFGQKIIIVARKPCYDNGL